MEIVSACCIGDTLTSLRRIRYTPYSARVALAMSLKRCGVVVIRGTDCEASGRLQAAR